MMNVDHAARPCRGDRLRKNAHVTSENDEIWVESRKRLGKRSFLSGAVGTSEASINQDEVNFMSGGECGRRFLVRHDRNDIDVEFAEFNAVQ